MLYRPCHHELLKFFRCKVPIALSLMNLSGAPKSQNIDFKALMISVVCRLLNCHSKIQQE